MIKIITNDTTSRARTTVLTIRSHSIKTPVLMPVATSGSVRGMWPQDLKELGYQILLSNTYHLTVRPGIKRIERAGGLHRFSGWNRGILTDSGGFQVFSLSKLTQIQDDFVRINSYLDGAPLVFTPESVVSSQIALGSDIIMPLDVCASAKASREEALRSVKLTARWAATSKKSWINHRQFVSSGGKLFGIVQGQFYKDLRRRAADELRLLDLPGYAVGGLSVGETRSQFLDFLSYSLELLPDDRPRYVMGIGSPDYAVEAVAAGADMFDCVYPTRVGRNARALTQKGPLSLRTVASGDSDDPIDSTCFCQVCTQFSRGYIRHLFNKHEIMGPVITTFHNLAFMAKLVDDIRGAVNSGTFSVFRQQFLSSYLGEHSDVQE